MTGFEPATPRTPCVYATRLRYIPKKSWKIYLVGVAGFEPATSCSQSRRDDRATLHPEKYWANIRLITIFTSYLIICFGKTELAIFFLFGGYYFYIFNPNCSTYDPINDLI